MNNYKNKVVCVFDLSLGLDDIDLAYTEDCDIIVCPNPRVVNYTKDEIVRKLEENFGRVDIEIELIDYETINPSIDEVDEYGKEVRDYIRNNLIPEIKKDKPKKITVVSRDLEYLEVRDIIFIEIP